ncbi:MAG: glycosyltransferase family 39 protein, partial [Bacteroidetes bacterium]|nr:glycosyltransferase family 39 protein [Bacteroidota bacterium]
MKIKIGILTGIVILFCFLTAVLYGNFIPDDTFIHIGFAKDIAAGKGFSFAGNKTFGSTAPLWPLLIALFSFLVGNLEITAKLLSLAFGVFGIGMFFSTAVHRWGMKKGALATLLLSFNPYMLRWAGTGMEATASVFWMTLFLVALLRKDQKYSSRWFYFVLGFAPLIRPEFYLVGFLFLLFKLLDRSISFSQILFFLIPIVLWNSFAALYFGTVVPSTFLAKAQDNFFAIEARTAIRSLKLFLTLNPIELLCIVGTLCFILCSRSS